MTIPKRPASTRPPPSIGPSQRPSNVKDALTEARAISGGNLGRPSTAPASFVGGRKTIMIVDDDAAMRAKLKEGLEPYYDVIEAKDGMEAADLAGKVQPPAMIVCDVVMPRVDGFTLAKILRGNPTMKKVPIMFVSSRNSPQDVTQALVLGACQYVLKSTPISDIVAKIRKIVS
ncbi:MAG: response regulator [Labilithrix sp.]|nr:response regulator [Labilithrix sp.]